MNGHPPRERMRMGAALRDALDPADPLPAGSARQIRIIAEPEARMTADHSDDIIFFDDGGVDAATLRDRRRRAGPGHARRKGMTPLGRTGAVGVIESHQIESGATGKLQRNRILTFRCRS